MRRTGRPGTPRSKPRRQPGAAREGRLLPATPTQRRLRVYSFDPSLSTRLTTCSINLATLTIPWERLGSLLGDHFVPGPVGDYLEVIDIDPASGKAYDPVNLDDPALLATDGVDYSDIDPKFHQQMVYAVAMNTITQFERALGRPAMWEPRWIPRTRREWEPVYVHRLRMYPHAMRQANAYYDPDKKAVLFGYFSAGEDGLGDVMPGSTIFTCLSHDVIAHETTHALLDGLHPYFTHTSNEDVLAFHEAFADIIALFSRFAMTDVVNQELERSRGGFESGSMLGVLAQEVGLAMGKRGALRTYIGRAPDPLLIRSTLEPHDRGAILVAAIYDAFRGIYQNRTRDLLRIATGGTGILPQGDLHPDLVKRLAGEAIKSAKHILTMCIRALDYCPPVDITFGDYLRSLITADCDSVPDDDKNYRVAVIEAFGRHGIYPTGVGSMSEESLRWERPELSETLKRCISDALDEVEQKRGRERYEAAPRRSGAGAAGVPDLLTPRGRAWQRMRSDCLTITRFLQKRLENDREVQRQLGVCIGQKGFATVHAQDAGPLSFQVNRLRQARRLGPGGIEVTDYVLEITQKRDGYLDPGKQKRRDSGVDGRGEREDADFLFRGGCTLNIDARSREIRYCVAKNILSDSRLNRQRAYVAGESPGTGMYADRASGQTFAMLHAH